MTNKDWLLVILLGLIWGSSFLFAEILLLYLPPLVIVYLRVGIAALVMVGIAVCGGMAWPRVDWLIAWRLLMMGLLNNVLPFSLIVIGQQTTTAGLASIINTTTAFFTILVAACFLPQERLTLSRTLGVLMGTRGVAIALEVQNLQPSMGGWLILLATLSYALAAVWGKKYLAHLPPLTTATGMLVSSTLLMSPYVWWQYPAALLNISPGALGAAVIFALLCTLVAYWLYFKVLNTAGAGNLAICTILVPPSAILLGWLILEQTITYQQSLGFLVMILGLLILDGRLLAKLTKLLR